MGAPSNIFDLIAARAEQRKMALGGQAPRYPLDKQVYYLETLAARIRARGRLPRIVDGRCSCALDAVCMLPVCPRPWPHPPDWYERTGAVLP